MLSLAMLESFPSENRSISTLYLHALQVRSVVSSNVSSPLFIHVTITKFDCWEVGEHLYSVLSCQMNNIRTAQEQLKVKRNHPNQSFFILVTISLHANRKQPKLSHTSSCHLLLNAILLATSFQFR